MILVTALLVNNLGLFILEIIGYNACHSVVMLLDGYYRLCQAMLCTVRIVSRHTQFTYTPRHTYGLARVGVVGELVAFITFVALSISVFLESIKHLIDVTAIIPKRESHSNTLLKPHGHEHIHSLIDNPNFILGVGIYATISNCLLGVALLYTSVKRSTKLNKQLKEGQSNVKQPLPKKLLSKSLLITDTLPLQHSFFQVLNMLLGPLAILTCGILLLMLSEKRRFQLLYSRLVDPIICCILFLSYLFMIYTPTREAIHLVLQAKPYGLKSDDIETEILASIPGVVKIHELHIWRLTPNRTLATIHVVFNTTENVLIKYQNIKLIFETHHIEQVTIQPEFSLASDEIEKLGYHNQCTTNNTECTPLQCCENPTTVVPNQSTASSRNVYFHRRSSIGLSADDADNDSETEQKNSLIKNSNNVISASSTTNSPIVITVNNEE